MKAPFIAVTITPCRKVPLCDLCPSEGEFEAHVRIGTEVAHGWLCPSCKAESERRFERARASIRQGHEGVILTMATLTAVWIIAFVNLGLPGTIGLALFGSIIAVREVRSAQREGVA